LFSHHFASDTLVCSCEKGLYGGLNGEVFFAKKSLLCYSFSILFLFCHEQAKQFPASSSTLGLLTELSLKKDKRSYSHKSKGGVKSVLAKKPQNCGKHFNFQAL